MSALGHSRPSNSSPGRPFVRYYPDSDRRRGNAAKAAKCQKQTYVSKSIAANEISRAAPQTDTQQA
jgi:hypothetical protein